MANAANLLTEPGFYAHFVTKTPTLATVAATLGRRNGQPLLAWPASHGSAAYARMNERGMIFQSFFKDHAYHSVPGTALTAAFAPGYKTAAVDAAETLLGFRLWPEGV